MKKNNHPAVGDLVEKLPRTLKHYVVVGDLVEERRDPRVIGLVVEIELNKPMGFSVQTEEPLFFNQARVLWCGKTSKPASSWRMFRELSVLHACNQKTN